MRLRIQRWFMPWRWSRSSLFMLVIAIILSPVIYILSAVPAWYVLLRFGPSMPEANDPFVLLSDAIYGIFSPAEWCGKNSSILEAVFDWEWDFMNRKFGDADMFNHALPRSES